MGKGQVVAAVLVLGVCLVVGAGVQAEEERGEDEVQAAQVPVVVMDAILKAANGNRIREIERESVNGRYVYEAEWRVKIEVEVGADGGLLSRAVEEKVMPSVLPAGVLATLGEQAKGGKVTEIERLTGNGSTLYGAEITIEEKKFDVTLTSDGKVVGREADDEDEQSVSLDGVPASVKATILKEADGSKVTEVGRMEHNGATVYEAEWTAEVEVAVAADGTLLSRQAGDDDDDDDDAQADDDD